MKAVFISIMVALIAVLSIVGINSNGDENQEYLRIHIRANSNSEKDQDIKYVIKGEIVKFLTPIVAECQTKSQAEASIEKRLNEIEGISNNVLRDSGFSYRAKAKIIGENFPTRVYEDITLEAGFYDALIIELGEASGDNWWCVVYPPLCFVGEGANYVYKSKLMEIINKFFHFKTSSQALVDKG